MFSCFTIYNNNPNKQGHIFTQLNDETVLFQAIQFSMSAKLKGSKYSHKLLTIQLNISPLFTHS